MAVVQKRVEISSLLRVTACVTRLLFIGISLLWYILPKVAGDRKARAHPPAGGGIPSRSGKSSCLQHVPLQARYKHEVNEYE